MKSNVTIVVLSGVLVSVIMAGSVLAGKVHHPGKMTCEEFVEHDDVIKPKIVYWAEGFNKKGEPVDLVLDVNRTDSLVPVLVTDCKETPKQSFWEKIKQHFKLRGQLGSQGLRVTTSADRVFGFLSVGK